MITATVGGVEYRVDFIVRDGGLQDGEHFFLGFGSGAWMSPRILVLNTNNIGHAIDALSDNKRVVRALQVEWDGSFRTILHEDAAEDYPEVVLCPACVAVLDAADTPDNKTGNTTQYWGFCYGDRGGTLSSYFTEVLDEGRMCVANPREPLCSRCGESRDNYIRLDTGALITEDIRLAACTEAICLSAKRDKLDVV